MRCQRPSAKPPGAPTSSSARQCAPNKKARSSLLSQRPPRLPFVAHQAKNGRLQAHVSPSSLSISAFQHFSISAFQLLPICRVDPTPKNRLNSIDIPLTPHPATLLPLLTSQFSLDTSSSSISIPAFTDLVRDSEREYFTTISTFPSRNSAFKSPIRYAVFSQAARSYSEAAPSDL